MIRAVRSGLRLLVLIFAGSGSVSAGPPKPPPPAAPHAVMPPASASPGAGAATGAGASPPANAVKPPAGASPGARVSPAGASRASASPATTPLPATAVSRLVEELVQRARAERLAAEPMWWRLLHYRSGWLGVDSEADGSPFFNAPDGKSNPEAELEATLRALFGPGPADARLQHPYCRFPARRLWLDSRLHFDWSRLPRQACPGWEEFHARVAARSLTIIFSSYYLNNPASAFGHTFLRLNQQPGERGERQELLDYGINYGADVDSNNAVLYAVKGLTGLFHGSFTKVPYYLKVREYNDFETRDLWEFELALDQAEVDRVVAHIWELGSTYFDYFYLSENCSYHMLGILEVASPRIQLISRLHWPVIPAATVQAIAANRGLIRKVSYRPSTRSQFRQRQLGLAGEELDAVFQLGQDPGAELPAGFSVAQRVAVFDAGLDLVDFRFSKDLLDPNTPESAFKQRLLARRAALLVPSKPLELDAPQQENPLIGHGTSRLELGGGYTSPYGPYYGLSFRLALHELGDPSRGYPDHLGIEFLPTRLRYYLKQQRPSLEETALISITSLVPLSRFFRSFSWNLRAGVSRVRDGGCDDCLVGKLELGAGAAVDAFERGLLFYATLNNHVAGLGPLTQGLFDLPLRAGVGPKAGLRLRFSDALTSFLQGDLALLPAQQPRYTWNASLVTRWSYTHNFALSVEAEAFPRGTSAQVSSTLYY